MSFTRIVGPLLQIVGHIVGVGIVAERVAYVAGLSRSPFVIGGITAAVVTVAHRVGLVAEMLVGVAVALFERRVVNEFVAHTLPSCSMGSCTSPANATCSVDNCCVWVCVCVCSNL